MTNTAILITGASTGIGAACAEMSARDGHRVFAGVRKLEDGERLVERAGEVPGAIYPVILDVTKPDQIAEARSAVSAALGATPLYGLVNNAGIAVAGPLEFVPVDQFRYQLEVNVTGQIAVTQAFLPLLRPAPGRIVFIGSTSGIFSTPFVGAYCASKFAIEAVADALRAELRPWKIDVSVIQPGPIETPIWEKSEDAANQFVRDQPPEALELYGGAIKAIRRYMAEFRRKTIPAERVADLVRHALFARRPRTRYLVGKGARLEKFLGRWVPDRLRDAIVCRELGI
ncbi:MAG: SDR family oxidoreductase [bacterium]|nr:SDR family oxidoreductase [bacterium]